MKARIRTWPPSLLAAACLTTAANAQFLEDFESCPSGNITNNGAPGCNGWQQWDSAPNTTSLVNTVVANSGAKSVSIDSVAGQTSDLVHRFTGYTSGHTTLRAWQYIPGPGAQPPLVPAHDKLYFLVLNKYQDFGPYDWSVQLTMDPVAGTWSIDAGSAATNIGSLVYDGWVPVRAEIDLATDRCEVFYNGASCAPPYSWTGGVFGGGSGALDIAALDLYHGPATVSVSGRGYWDDVSLRQPGTPDPVSYCYSKTTSNGCIPLIDYIGTSNATASSGFVVTGSHFINNKICLLFYGLSGATTTPFQNGVLCVKAPVKRTVGTSTGGGPPPNNCSGAPSIDMNAFAHGALGGAPSPGLLVPGSVVYCQWWGRDQGYPAPNNTQLSNALAYTVGPVTASGSLFKNMVFNNVTVKLSNTTTFNHTAALNGTINMSSAGDPNGSVVVAFDDGSSATIMMTPGGGTFIQTGASMLDLQTPGTSWSTLDSALLNGSPVSLSALADQLQSYATAGISPLFMPDSSRAMLALASLNQTSQWNLNASIALQMGGALPGLGSLFCKLTIWCSIAAFKFVGDAICTSICAGIVGMVLGLFKINCTKLCAAGVLFLAAKLETFLLGMWNP